MVSRVCSATEVLRRFSHFGTELLCGAETNWWPRRNDKEKDPFATTTVAAGAALYPNSGLLLATRRGLAALVATLRAMSLWPCCPPPFIHGGDAQCLVEDQGCLQAALVSGDVPHRLDVGSEIFWNVGCERARAPE